MRLVQALEADLRPLWQDSNSWVPGGGGGGWGWSLGSKRPGPWGTLREGAVTGGQRGLSHAGLESEDSYALRLKHVPIQH